MTIQRITVLVAFALAAVACGGDNPGTSIEISLRYDDALGLDTADVTVAMRTQSAPITHRMLLLVSDQAATMEMPIEVWGRKAGKRTAYGTATAVPALGQTQAVTVTLSACSPGCQGDTLTTCTGPAVACALGCSDDGDARCVAPRASNGVDVAAAGAVQGTTTIAASATFDTDTGEITGGLVRAPGTGDGGTGGVGYLQAPASAAGGAPLAIFVFHNLTVNRAATVRFTGGRAAVLLVGDAARIDGTIDVTAGRGARGAAGPGGGAGGTTSAVATGCGPGGAGRKGTINDVEDSGGAGGGGGTAGGRGGDAFTDTEPTSRTAGGAAGTRCLPMDLQPLQGGSGGGAGSIGVVGAAAGGGGGGGALQITALGSIAVTGTILAGGAGGDAGLTSDVNDASGGAGGGSGGAILLEAPDVTVGASAVLAANGGGGGGGGSSTPGEAGEAGLASTTPAAGGFSGSVTGTTGGDGGTAIAAPLAGGDGSSNGAGGGGAAGAIAIRSAAGTLDGIITPEPVQLDLILE